MVPPSVGTPKCRPTRCRYPEVSLPRSVGTTRCRNPPKIITENFSPASSYFGIIKCKVQPPRKIFHPVLPYRHSGKLLFPLCRTCAETQCDLCNHSDEERALTWAWVSLELFVAEVHGYKVHFDCECQFNMFPLMYLIYMLRKCTRCGTTLKTALTTPTPVQVDFLRNTSTNSSA